MPAIDHYFKLRVDRAESHRRPTPRPADLTDKEQDLCATIDTVTARGLNLLRADLKSLLDRVRALEAKLREDDGA